MTPEDLEAVVALTGHERFRWLVSADNPNAKQREAYRRHVARLAATAPTNDYPPLLEQAGNLLKAAGRFVASGGKTVDEETYQARLSICRECPLYDAAQGRCRECGCRTQYKVRMATESCPHPDGPRWVFVEDDLSHPEAEEEQGGGRVVVPAD